MAVGCESVFLSVFATVGKIRGVFFINLLNMQSGCVYKLNHPSNTDVCQVFPQDRRRGKYGYDGISIQQ